MNKAFENLIENCNLNNYIYHITKTKTGEDCVIVVRKACGSMFAYTQEYGELKEVGEARFSFNKSNGILRLNFLMISPDMRRFGIGKKMVESLIDYATTINCKKIMLCSSTSAVGFYNKLGFELTSSPDDFRSIVFQKKLTNLNNELQNNLTDI